MRSIMTSVDFDLSREKCISSVIILTWRFRSSSWRWSFERELRSNWSLMIDFIVIDSSQDHRERTFWSMRKDVLSANWENEKDISHDCYYWAKRSSQFLSLIQAQHQLIKNDLAFLMNFEHSLKFSFQGIKPICIKCWLRNDDVEWREYIVIESDSNARMMRINDNNFNHISSLEFENTFKLSDEFEKLRDLAHFMMQRHIKWLKVELRRFKLVWNEWKTIKS